MLAAISASLPPCAQVSSAGSAPSRRCRRAVTVGAHLPEGGDDAARRLGGLREEDEARPPPRRGAAASAAPANHRGHGDKCPHPGQRRIPGRPLVLRAAARPRTRRGACTARGRPRQRLVGLGVADDLALGVIPISDRPSFCDMLARMQAVADM
jgi:hypothetical protein